MGSRNDRVSCQRRPESRAQLLESSPSCRPKGCRPTAHLWHCLLAWLAFFGMLGHAENSFFASRISSCLVCLSTVVVVTRVAGVFWNAGLCEDVPERSGSWGGETVCDVALLMRCALFASLLRLYRCGMQVCLKK